MKHFEVTTEEQRKDEIKMNFGKKFKQARHNREISRESAVKSLGIDEETLILIEDDLISPPLRLAKSMTELLDMTLEEFLEEEEEEENEEEGKQ